MLLTCPRTVTLERAPWPIPPGPGSFFLNDHTPTGLCASVVRLHRTIGPLLHCVSRRSFLLGSTELSPCYALHPFADYYVRSLFEPATHQTRPQSFCYRMVALLPRCALIVQCSRTVPLLPRLVLPFVRTDLRSFPELSRSHLDVVPPNATASTDWLLRVVHKTRLPPIGYLTVRPRPSPDFDCLTLSSNRTYQLSV